MAWHAETYKDLQLVVRTMRKHNVGAADTPIFEFSGFVLQKGANVEEAGAQRIHVRCLTEEGYRREEWALEAAIDEAKAIIDGRRKPLNADELRAGD